MANESSPFHMREIDDNVSVLPKDADIPPENHPEDVTFVDIGSIQMDPNTSRPPSLFVPSHF